MYLSHLCAITYLVIVSLLLKNLISSDIAQVCGSVSFTGNLCTVLYGVFVGTALKVIFLIVKNITKIF